jgi:hypothetical protein
MKTMKPDKTISVKGLTFLITAATVLFLMAGLAFAQSSTRVYLQPVEAPQGTLTVEVMAENVTNLYGAEFKLKYDPAVLAIQDAKPDQDGIQVEAGTLLPPDQGFVVANEADQAEGSVTFAMTLLNPAPPANGTGPLARVTFQVLQSTPSTINVEKAKLVGFDLQTITAEAVAFNIGGSDIVSIAQPEAAVESGNAPATTAPAASLTTAPAVPAVTAVTPAETPAGSDFPWWIVAVGVMLLGLIGLGTFAIMGGIGKPQKVAQPQPARPQAAAPQPVQPQPQQRERPRTRPSAFK